MSHLVATSALALSVSGTAVVGTASVTSSPSTKVKAGGSGVYRGPMNVSIAPGCTNGTCTSTAPTAAIINPTATKMKVESQLVIRENDEVTATVAGVLSSGGACTFPATVTVNNAGQTKVKGN